MGVAFKTKKRLEDAAAEYRKAIDVRPDYAEAHCNLAEILRLQGQLSASLDSYKRGHALGSKRKDWPYQSAQWVAVAERLVQLEAKLPDVLAGKVQLADNRERAGYLGVCQLQQRHAAAAQLYADAFAADPNLVADVNLPNRYEAICHAALAAVGQGTDADKLDDKERTRLRKQALDWLRADLVLWTNQAVSDKLKDRELVQKRLKHWQDDTDLVGIRDKDALAKLPADERETCEKLWADVAELLKKANDAK